MTAFSLLRSKLWGKAKMTGTKFIPLIMLTYVVLPKPVQVRSVGYSNTCPADYLPSGKDENSCPIKIADTESLTTFLKQKTIWQDGYVQHARISIAIVGNVTDNTAPAPKDWLISYIDPSGPFYYVSWRSDFKVLSFGLLDDKPDQKIDIDIVENGDNNCTIQRSNKEITSQVVEYLTKDIRKANVTDNDQDYANIDLCFLTRFTWFIESPWYFLKKYFGVPFQEFGYRCCNYFNGTVCCDDKLKEMEGYRIVPYIMSVIIFCYIPLLFVRIGHLFTVFHPRHWYAADKQVTAADKKNTAADQNETVADKKEITANKKDTFNEKDYISMFGNVFFSEDPSEDPCEDHTEDPSTDAPKEKTPDKPSILCIDFERIKSEFLARKFRIAFVLFLPTAIYIELCIYASAYEWKAHIQDVVEDGMLFGFTSMLGDPLDVTFLSPLGPLGALVTYHVLGVLLLILPKNFETDVIEDGTCHCITGFISKIAPQGCNLAGYKKFERVLKTGIYLWFNMNFWKTDEREDKDKKKDNTSPSKKKCLNFWCIYNSWSKKEHKKSSNESKHHKDKNSPLESKHQEDKSSSKESEQHEDKDLSEESEQHDNKDLSEKSTVESIIRKLCSSLSTFGKRGFLLMFLPIPLFPFYFVILNGWFRYMWYEKDENKKDEEKKNKYKIRFVKNPVFLLISFVGLVTFFYFSSVIVSYSIYLFVYVIYFMCLALVTSPKQTSTYLMFVFMGIVFVIQMFKDTLKFYKDVFDLTLDECENNFKMYIREDENYVLYLNKKVARFVQKKIRPFYVEIGQMFFKTVIVGLTYSAALLFLTNYSLAISDVLQNMTALVTSALPTIIQSQLKPELPTKRVIRCMVKCYMNEEKTKKKDEEKRINGICCCICCCTTNN